jgi:hypothetical protein
MGFLAGYDIVKPLEQHSNHGDHQKLMWRMVCGGELLREREVISINNTLTPFVLLFMLYFISNQQGTKKVKLSPVEAVGERLRLPHIQTFGSPMAARLSALRAGRFLPPERFLVLTSVRD